MVMEVGIYSMTKAEIKKIVKTCVETLANVKDIDLSIFDIRDDKTLGALVFDIRLEPNFGTSLYLDCRVLEYNNDKAEFGKAVMSKIWGDIRDHLENDLDKQMRRMGMNKINIPGFNGMGGVYQQSNAPTPQIKNNGDGTYTISIGGCEFNCNNSQEALDTLVALHNKDDDYDFDDDTDGIEVDSGKWGGFSF